VEQPVEVVRNSEHPEEHPKTNAAVPFESKTRANFLVSISRRKD